MSRLGVIKLSMFINNRPAFPPKIQARHWLRNAADVTRGGRSACFRGFSGVVCLFTRALITLNFSQNSKLKMLQRSRVNL